MNFWILSVILCYKWFKDLYFLYLFWSINYGLFFIWRHPPPTFFNFEFCLYQCLKINPPRVYNSIGQLESLNKDDNQLISRNLAQKSICPALHLMTVWFVRGLGLNYCKCYGGRLSVGCMTSILFCSYFLRIWKYRSVLLSVYEFSSLYYVSPSKCEYSKNRDFCSDRR